MCLPLVRRLRVCLSLRRAERVAARARALEAMRRSMHALRVALRSCPSTFGVSTSGLQACASSSQSVAKPSGAAFDATGGFVSGSGLTTAPIGTGTERGSAQAHARRASISAASVR
eukprot:6211780-Pleurochrysis_carterae.AAC.3